MASFCKEVTVASDPAGAPFSAARRDGGARPQQCSEPGHGWAQDQADVPVAFCVARASAGGHHGNGHGQIELFNPYHHGGFFPQVEIRWDALRALAVDGKLRVLRPMGPAVVPGRMVKMPPKRA